MARHDIPNGRDEPWWAHVLGGAVLLAITCYLYSALTAFEASGGQLRMQWILVLIYNRFGKWPILIVFAIAGIGLIFLGINRAFSPSTKKTDDRSGMERHIEIFEHDEER